jgi:hypothetical protein
MAFPGGKQDFDDFDDLDTAERETFEEGKVIQLLFDIIIIHLT